MTKPLNILALGRNAEIMTVMQRLLNAPDNWYGLATTTNGVALEALQNTTFDIVLICAGISEEEEANLAKQFKDVQPDVIVRRHYGGGSGLLVNEIMHLLHSQQ
jgi:hypothetical protein